MNPYGVLGVSENATDEEIAKAYKRLAKKYHPDLNPGNDAAAQKMGEINRAYDDIKTMRQSGTSYREYAAGQQTGYGGYETYDPFAQARRNYTYYYRKPKIDPVGMILAAVVMMFLVRFLLSLLFGGFGTYYYTDPGYSYGYAPPEPGYYQIIP